MEGAPGPDVSAPETPAEDASDRPARRSSIAEVSRTEIIGVIALAIISAVLVAVWSENLWFQKDAWDYLSKRDLSSISSLMEPHGDHWILPTAVMFRVLYETVGIDFWPWYFVPRLVGHILMIAALWWVLRKRGTEPVVAFGAYAVLLVMSANAWQVPSTIGNFIIFPMLWFSALLVAKVREPTMAHRVLLFAMLLFGISANSMGVAGLAGIGLATLIYRRVWQWWPSIAGVGLVYVWWYLTYRGFGATSGAARPNPFKFIEIASNILGDGFTRTLGIPEVLGVAFVVGFVAFIGWIIWTRRIDVFDATMLITLLVYFGLIISIRFVGGAANAEHVRWGQRVALLFLPVVIPYIRLGASRWKHAAFGAVVIVAVVGNLIALHGNLEGEVRRATLRREFAESAAQAVAEGAPTISRRRLNQSRTGTLTAEGLEKVVDEGWAPTRQWRAVALEEARVRIRVNVGRGGKIKGEPPTTSLPLRDTQLGLCLTVTDGEPVELGVTGSGEIRVNVDPETSMSVGWVDEFGEGTWRGVERFLPIGQNNGTLTVADPPTTAVMTITAEGGGIRLCGLSPP